MCETCGNPERLLWGFSRYPEMQDVLVGDWIKLQACHQCGRLWCLVPHEPHASFVFITAWPYGKAEFSKLNEIDGAKILHEWHDAMIREYWQSLPEDERNAIGAWRQRTYMHYNPIDKGYATEKFKYVKDSVDLAKYIDS